MKRYLSVMFLLLFVCAFTPNALAALIYDTGPGSETGLRYVLSSYQWLGKKVVFNEDYILNKIEGWMNVSANDQFKLSIYSDTNNNNLPDYNLGTWYENLTLTSSAEWKSFDINFVATKNSPYWIYYETTSGYGDMPGGIPQSLIPDNYGYFVWQPSRSHYNAGNLNFGVRVYGDVVPEPASLSLLGLGLLGLVGLGRKKGKR